MKAAIFREFQGPITIETVADPQLPDDGVIIKVGANGICRSDWHGWMGHDPSISLPHVPGHELAGTVADVGKDVRKWQVGDRVTVPFSCGCGTCGECASGNQHICDNDFQPGFSGWGSFAELVAIRYADVNLVKLPDDMDFVTAASLGCRFVTSYRAVIRQGRVRPGEWVAVHGCGGVGMSAIMIASAMGAQVVAIDIDDAKLEFAKSIGAAHVVNAKETPKVVKAVRTITGGGANLSLDCLGSSETAVNSIRNLRKRGRHVQVGLMLAAHSRPAVPMAFLHAMEVELLGSHGMQAWEYPGMLDMIAAGTLRPEKLIGETVSLEDSAEILMNMNSFKGVGVSVINRF